MPTKVITEHEVSESVSGYMMIENAKSGMTTKKKPFLDITLKDRGGALNTKLWDSTPNDIDMYMPGVIVHVTGEISEYNEKKQITLRTIRAADLQNETINREDLYEIAPIPRVTLEQEINAAIFMIQNAIIRQITRAVVTKYHEAFYRYPAAKKVHHAYESGLAEHSVCMLRGAISLCQLYPNLNKDLMMSIPILHDIGKIYEFVSLENTQYTPRGKLIGHIAMMDAELHQTAIDLGINPMCEEIMLMRHMVLSHHGRPEWGSATRPQTLEAEMLHMLDNIDARINMVSRELNQTKPGEFTEKIYGADNRQFYKPIFSSEGSA